MTTDSILRPGELKDILLREIAAADLTTADVSEVGTVLEVRDGIARIYGLKSAVVRSAAAISRSRMSFSSPGRRMESVAMW